ncbi:uncharacterized protein LOC135396862 [Ornithodoros turicata]
MSVFSPEPGRPPRPSSTRISLHVYRQETSQAMWKVVILATTFCIAAAAPREGITTSKHTRDTVSTILDSLPSQAALQRVRLLDRSFRLSFGAFSGQTDLSGGLLRGLPSLSVVDLTSPGKDSFRVGLRASNLTLEYKANVTFSARSDICEMKADVDFIVVDIELQSDGDDQLAISNAEATEMSDLDVKFVGLQAYSLQADLLSRLFASAFRYDIEDELVSTLETVVDDLLFEYNQNGS